jgi:16S rRNA (cytosine1402-N4)-methyltransferase
MSIVHVPVMLEEVIEAMKVKKSGVYVDGTVGLGGHAEGILRSIAGGCTLVGIDRDSEALEIAKKRLKNKDVHLVKDNFSNIVSIVKKLGYKEVDGILLDLGVSSLQLKAEGRGFSFLKEEPLDMRMDKGQELTAGRIVNVYAERELTDILWRYGEERFCRRIARAIVAARSQSPIKTCRELAQIIEKTVRRGRKFYFPGRIHPATRTFQALRIEVNKELTALSLAIEAGVTILKHEARFCVLSYHSLEDRIIKHSFRQMAKNGLVAIITKKPLVPSEDERDANPSSRSAKLRVVEKV